MTTALSLASESTFTAPNGEVYISTALVKDGKVLGTVLVRYWPEGEREADVSGSGVTIKSDGDTWGRTYRSFASSGPASEFTGEPSPEKAVETRLYDAAHNAGHSWLTYAEEGAEVPTGQAPGFQDGIEVGSYRSGRKIVDGKVQGKPRSY